MIRTGDEYRESIRDGREVWIDGEQVADVTTHPAFKPIVDVRARIYDLAHEPETRDVMTYTDAETAERCAGTLASRRCTRDDWRAKRAAVDAILDDLGGVVTRVGDETVGEMWSLFDGQDVLNEIDPAFSAEHPRPRPPRRAGRPVPRLGQHRPEGRPLPAAAGPGPRRAAARRPRDRRRHRGARRQVRDRGGLRQPGVRQADDRRVGQRRALRLRGRLPRRHGRPGHQAHLPLRLRRPRAGRRLPADQPVRRDRHA